MDHIINNPCISHVFKNIIKLRSPDVNIDEDFKPQEEDHSNIFKIIFNKNKCTDIFKDSVILEQQKYMFGAPVDVGTRMYQQKTDKEFIQTKIKKSET